MPDFYTSYSAIFGSWNIDCEVSYSVEPDEPRDTLLVDSVEVSQIRVVGPLPPASIVRLGVVYSGKEPGLEPITNALATEIGFFRKDEIFKRCQESYERYHKPRRSLR